MTTVRAGKQINIYFFKFQNVRFLYRIYASHLRLMQHGAPLVKIHGITVKLMFQPKVLFSSFAYKGILLDTKIYIYDQITYM